MSRKIVWVNNPTHQKLKIEAARRGITMGEMISRLLDVELRTHTRPSGGGHDQQLPPSLKKTHQIARSLASARYKEVTMREIRPIIARVAGGDPRTMRKYLLSLLDEQVLVEHAPGVWRVNHEGGWLPYHVEA